MTDTRSISGRFQEQLDAIPRLHELRPMTRPMDETEIDLCINMCNMDLSRNKSKIQFHTNLQLTNELLKVEPNLPPLVKIFLSRLPSLEGLGPVYYSLPTIIMLSYLADNPARAVAWAFWLYRETVESMEAVTMMRFGLLFPVGVPTEEAYRTVWLAQKVSGENGGRNAMDNYFMWDQIKPRSMEKA